MAKFHLLGTPDRKDFAHRNMVLSPNESNFYQVKPEPLHHETMQQAAKRGRWPYQLCAHTSEDSKAMDSHTQPSVSRGSVYRHFVPLRCHQERVGAVQGEEQGAKSERERTIELLQRGEHRGTYSFHASKDGSIGALSRLTQFAEEKKTGHPQPHTRIRAFSS